MDPATVFAQYAAASMFLWLGATCAPAVVSVVSRVGAALPAGRDLAAFAISLVLLVGVMRPVAADATVWPPSVRMAEMASQVPETHGVTAITVLSRPSVASPADTYTVASGDSLWQIARHLLSSRGVETSGVEIAASWNSLYELNRDVIGENPHLIHPGQVLQLPTR
ncbi:MAG: LysM peptidoglycan-binding domain-containing protein [Actinomycetota bacterium]|nr:LysM peptidoglycan-binding domain-containing protein [Actinomycetota bacterium]